MPASINYKNKYIELRSKYMADIDVAFRLGFEAGAQQAQQQQAMEAKAQVQESEQRMAEAQTAGMNGQPGGPEEGGNLMEGGQPGPEGNDPQGGQAPGGQQPTVAGQPSELDQHINKLEGMLGSGASPEIQKSLQDIKSLRKKEKLDYDMKQGDLAIKGIAKALHKPAFKLSAQATHNMNDSAKAAVTLQHKIVNDVFKSWQTEEAKASKDIANILSVEGILKE